MNRTADCTGRMFHNLFKCFLRGKTNPRCKRGLRLIITIVVKFHYRPSFLLIFEGIAVLFTMISIVL